MDRPEPGNPGTPAFLLLHTTPDVVHASAVLASGGRRYVWLSPVIEDFWLRFGAVPLPDEDPLAGVEIRSRLQGVRLIELWRPPGRVRPRPATMTTIADDCQEYDVSFRPADA